MTQHSISTATETALRLLAQRSLSEAELRQRLAKREFPNDTIDAAVEAMRDYRYLDDAKLAESVRVAASRRGKGPRWIHSTLRRRGVAAPLADQAAQVDTESQVEQAVALLRQRFPQGVPDGRTRQRAYRFLCGRGFTSSSIVAALGAGSEYPEGVDDNLGTDL